jgi:hypothetical protein
MSRCEICDFTQNWDCQSISHIPVEEGLTDEQNRVIMNCRLGKNPELGGFICKRCALSIQDTYSEWNVDDEHGRGVKLYDREEDVEVFEDSLALPLWEEF